MQAAAAAESGDDASEAAPAADGRAGGRAGGALGAWASSSSESGQSLVDADAAGARAEGRARAAGVPQVPLARAVGASEWKRAQVAPGGLETPGEPPGRGGSDGSRPSMAESLTYTQVASLHARRSAGEPRAVPAWDPRAGAGAGAGAGAWDGPAGADDTTESGDWQGGWAGRAAGAARPDAGGRGGRLDGSGGLGGAQDVPSGGDVAPRAEAWWDAETRRVAAIAMQDDGALGLGGARAVSGGAEEEGEGGGGSSSDGWLRSGPESWETAVAAGEAAEEGSETGLGAQAILEKLRSANETEVELVRASLPLSAPEPGPRRGAR
jgi:hypothetical protein